MAADETGNGHRPPTDVRLYQRRKAAGSRPTTTTIPTTTIVGAGPVESESGAMGTTDGETATLVDWLNRLEDKLDNVIQNVLPRVAALETNVAALLEAPGRFRAWSSWAIGLVMAAMGCFGCVGTLSSLVGIASFILVLVTRLR